MSASAPVRVGFIGLGDALDRRTSSLGSTFLSKMSFLTLFLDGPEPRTALEVNASGPTRVADMLKFNAFGLPDVSEKLSELPLGVLARMVDTYPRSFCVEGWNPTVRGVGVLIGVS